MTPSSHGRRTLSLRNPCRGTRQRYSLWASQPSLFALPARCSCSGCCRANTEVAYREGCKRESADNCWGSDSKYCTDHYGHSASWRFPQSVFPDPEMGDSRRVGLLAPYPRMPPMGGLGMESERFDACAGQRCANGVERGRRGTVLLSDEYIVFVDGLERHTPWKGYLGFGDYLRCRRRRPNATMFRSRDE